MSIVAAQVAKGALRIKASYEGQDLDRIFYRSSLVVGRSGGSSSQPDFDLAPDNKVSRQHARIWVENGSCWIEDLASKFGTRVDGKDIRGSGKVRLEPTSRVLIGGTTVEVETHVDDSSGFAELPAQGASASAVEIDRTIDPQPGRLILQKASTLDAIQKQTLLLEILIQFSLPAPLEQLLQTIIGRVIELIPGAKRGALLLRNRMTDRLLLAAFVSPAEPAVSETLARRALKQQQAFVWRNKFGSDYAQSIRRHQIQSGMYAPLIYDDKPLGVLCVDNPDCDTAFTDEDLQLLVTVADHAAVAVSHHQSRQELLEKNVLLEALLSNLSPDARNRMLEKVRCAHVSSGAGDAALNALQADIRELWQSAAPSKT